MTYLISFLIPTLRERGAKFKSLTDKIFLQIEEHNLQDEVEVLSIYDNRSIKLSTKRNMMQKMARGMYFLHLDDDDRVADDYCITLVTEIRKLVKYSYAGTGNQPVPDVITYNQFCEVNGKFMIVKTNPKKDMSLNFLGMEGDIPVYERTPWQWHLWNKARFGHIYRTDVDTNAREDQNWLKKAYLEYPNSFYNIDKILHYYYFDTNGCGENKSTCQ